MQIRIRDLYRAAPEAVQRATQAFAAPIENMGIDHVVISDSVPVGRLQRASTQRIFALGSKSQGVTATGNIYCRSQIYKKNYFFTEDTFTQIQGPTAGTVSRTPGEQQGP